MKATDLVDGEIYHLTTEYRWIVRFRNLDKECINGYGCIENSRYGTKYRNDIDIHTEIREATQEEKEMYIKLERPEDYIPSSTTPTPLLYN